MNMKLNALFLPFLTGCALISQAASVDELKEAYYKRFRQLRNLLLSVDGNRESAENIVRIQKEIRELEITTGIRPLAIEIGKLRIESCNIQNEDPKAKEILSQIAGTTEEIKNATTQERAQMDRITRLKETTRDPQTRKKHEAALHRIDKRIKEKTKPQTQQLAKLNQSLRDVPALSEKLDEVVPLSMKMRKKYESIQDQLTPLDERLSSNVKAIHRRIRPERGKLKKLRIEINNLRKEIVKQKPCFAAEESLKPVRWERLFA